MKMKKKRGQKMKEKKEEKKEVEENIEASDYDKTLAVLETWKEKKVWKGTIEERKEKFQWIHNKLNEIYEKETILAFVDVKEEHQHVQGASIGSIYDTERNTIFLYKKLSVMTYLTLYAFSLGLGDTASSWADDLFKKTFPVSHGKLINVFGVHFKPE